MNELKITIKGTERPLNLGTFRAMKAIGMKGPLDGAGLERALNEAVQSWEGLDRLLKAGGVEVSEGDLDDWGVVEIKRLLEMVPAAFGLEATVETKTEGEQSGPPADSRSGLSVVPLPDTISA